VSGSSTDVAGTINVDEAVRNRYSQAAEQRESQLCCPVDYDARYLKVIPDEILERDYGCGDPSRFLKPGEHVLDLGSGGGKICYIASQVVGPEGSVVGVDCNDEMLDLARRYRSQVAERLGYQNVEFRKGRIQDLQLNLDLVDGLLQDGPIQSAADWLRLEEQLQDLRARRPLIPAASIDVVVSNCVLNLVRNADRRQLFDELHRVLKEGGRAVISDIVSDRDVPLELQNDPQLWSGCISGAFREDRFIDAFSQAGFHGMRIVSRQAEAWAVVEGIEFRSMTVEAHKADPGADSEQQQQVIYHGPWKEVMDDRGQKLVRGTRTQVGSREAVIFCRAPYAGQVTAIAAATTPGSSAGEPPEQTDVSAESPAGSENLQILGEGDCCGPSGCC